MVTNPLRYAGPEVRHVSCGTNSHLHGRYDAPCSIKKTKSRYWHLFACPIHT